MNKKIKILLLIFAVPILLSTLIIADFKNTKTSSKRVAEHIKIFFSSPTNLEINHSQKKIVEIHELHKYLIENSEFYEKNNEKINIILSIENKENFYKRYELRFDKALESIKKLKISKDRYFLIKRNLIRLYDFDDKYLEIVSDNSYILKKSVINISKNFFAVLFSLIILIYLAKKFHFQYHIKIWKAFLSINFENEKIYYFILFFSSFNFIYPKFSSDYWYFFYSSLIIFVVIYYKKFNQSSKKNYFPIISLIFAFIMCHNFFFNYGYMGTGSEFNIDRKLILIFSVLPMIFYLLKKLNYKEHTILIGLFLGFSFIQFRSFTENIVTVLDLIILNIIVFTNYFLLKSSKNNNTLLFLTFIFIIVISSFLSFRTDYLYLQEEGFHISFFVAPVIAQMEPNGFRLLSDQPSQYGFLNILLPSLLSFKNGLNSFHIFQSSMMVLTIVISYLIILKAQIKLNKVFFYLFFTILFFLSDPTLIGPNPYPSSSILRFFPVYLLIFLNESFDLNPFNKFSHTKIILLSFIFSLSFLWSIESFCYVAFPFVIYSLMSLYNSYEINRLKILVRNIFKIFFLFLLIVGLTLILYKITYNLDQINIKMIFLSVLAYGEGYMTVSLTPFSPMLIIALPIFLIISKINNLENFKLNFYLLLMIGLLSYFFGRAVPNNILALWPIYFLCFGLVTSFIEKKIIKICLIPMLLIISVTLVSILKNHELLTIENLRPKLIFEKNILKTYEITSNDFPDDLNSYMLKIPKEKSLTVLSFGDFGKNLIRMNGNPNFIPRPFHLFSIPINPEDSAKILYNSTRFRNSDGYIIFDRKWSKHYVGFFNKIKDMKECQIEFKSVRFDAYYCEKGFIK